MLGSRVALLNSLQSCVRDSSVPFTIPDRELVHFPNLHHTPSPAARDAQRTFEVTSDEELTSGHICKSVGEREELKSGINCETML